MPLSSVALSRGSAPAMAFMRSAQSATERAIGPAVSWLWAMGTMPVRLTNPSVGFNPARLLHALGEVIEPSVSVPMAAAQRFAATATPEPELEPLGERSNA
jgi:hypothetical protein